MLIDDLILCLKAKDKHIWIDSYEEDKVIEMLKDCINLTYPKMQMIKYTVGFGRQRLSVNNEQVEKYSPRDRKVSITPMLSAMAYNEELEDTMIVMPDCHHILQGPGDARAIKEFHKEETLNGSYVPLIMIAPVVKIPAEQEKIWTVLKHSTPDKEEIMSLLGLFNKALKANGADDKDLISVNDIEKCADYARGLTEDQIKTIMRKSKIKNGTLLPEMFHQAKLDEIKKTGMLQYIEPNTTMDSLGGNENFKEWIQSIKRCNTKEAKDFGVKMSKGYLALGIPGTAKSHAANMVANEMELPLLKFEMSSTMHSHVGQSERNMAEAINMIKACKPCILYIDEIEKVLGGKRCIASNAVLLEM